MVKIIKPKMFVGIFFDGVSPKAKMNLQRQRRFRECKKCIDKCKFKFNNVSTGTKFMEEISDIIQVKIQEKKNLDKFWENIEVFFSGPNVVGEAENKIFEHLKGKNITNYKKLKGCIYTSDSDFDLLALANHCYDILIYNENANKTFKNHKKCYISIEKFRQIIIDFFEEADIKYHNQLIDDFICLCFLSENNYLPGIHDVLFDDIIEVYKKNRKTIGFINNNGKLNERNLKKYLFKLKEETNSINKMIYYLDKKMDSDSTKNNNSDKTNNNNNNKTIKFGMNFKI